MVLGKDADDGVGAAVEVERAAYDGGIGIEVSPPEVVPQDDDLLRIQGRIAAAVGDGQSESREVIEGSLYGEDLAGLGAVVPIDESLFVGAGDIEEDSAVAQGFNVFGFDVAVAAQSDGDQG